MELIIPGKEEFMDLICDGVVNDQMIELNDVQIELLEAQSRLEMKC